MCPHHIAGLVLIICSSLCVQQFVIMHSAEEVTTYIHIFIYHYGYFLEKYSGVEKFSNYVLESKHSLMLLLWTGTWMGLVGLVVAVVAVAAASLLLCSLRWIRVVRCWQTTFCAPFENLEVLSVKISDGSN